MKPVTLIFLIAGASLAVLHYLSLELHLYWRFLWLDIPIHALGGAVVALGYLSLRDFFPNWPQQYFGFYIVTAFVVMVAFIWEVFEVMIGVVFEPDRYVIDTTTDLLVGLFGGVVGYFVGKSLREIDHV